MMPGWEIKQWSNSMMSYEGIQKNGITCSAMNECDAFESQTTSKS